MNNQKQPVWEDASPKLRNKSDVLWFGKHKGETVAYVLENDPEYLEWLIGETNNTDFDQNMSEKIHSAAEFERDRDWFMAGNDPFFYKY